MRKLSRENYGKPTFKDIEINPLTHSEYIPQAWERDGEWYYNWIGALEEARYSKNILPKANELLQLVDSEIMKTCKVVGYINCTDSNKYIGDNIYFWSSSKNGNGAKKVFYDWTDSPLVHHTANDNWSSRSHGYSVRFIDRSEEIKNMLESLSNRYNISLEELKKLF